MFQLFSGRHGLSVPALLRQFAIEVDEALREQGLVVLNGPDQSKDTVDEELDIQVSLIRSALYQMDTTEGPVLTRTPSGDARPITLANPDEVRDYYNQLASTVLDRKKGTCLGLAGAALSLSRSLLAKDQYRQIEIQICQLRQWSHVFVRFVHPKEPQGLFYDPWYQRCQTATPEVPLLIEEHEFATRMERLIDSVSLQQRQTILRIKYFMEYDLHKQSPTGGMKINRDYNFDYCILCSSKKFSNPGKIVLEPRSRKSASHFQQNNRVSPDATLIEGRELGCICS